MNKYLQIIQKYKIAGLFLPPEKLLKRIEDFVIRSWLQQVYVHNLESLEEDEFRGTLEKHKKEKFKIIELCQKFKSNIRSELLETVSENFEIDKNDLKNWNIINIKEIENFNILLIVELNFYNNSTPYFHSDNDELMKIVIGLRPDIFNLAEVKKNLIYLRDTVKHEISHAAQKIVQIIKNLKEPIGLPKDKLRNKKHDALGYNYLNKNDEELRIKHHLQDIEFHTNLNDFISEFIRNIKHIPKELRYDYFKRCIETSYNNEDKIIKYVKKYGLNYNLLFFRLKRDNFNKYKQAVKEFYKAVKDKI